MQRLDLRERWPLTLSGGITTVSRARPRLKASSWSAGTHDLVPAESRAHVQHCTRPWQPLGHRRPHHQASSSNPTKAKHQPPFSLQALGLMRCDDSRSQQCATIRSRVD